MVIGTLCRESSVVVNFAMIWVMVVAKNMCHVVKKRAVSRSMEFLFEKGWIASSIEDKSYGSLFEEGKVSNNIPQEELRLGGKKRGIRIGASWKCLGYILNLALASTHLLKIMTPEEHAIQALGVYQLPIRGLV